MAFFVKKLGIDLGTSGLRVVLMDEDGRILAVFLISGLYFLPCQEVIPGISFRFGIEIDSNLMASASLFKSQSITSSFSSGANVQVE